MKLPFVLFEVFWIARSFSDNRYKKKGVHKMYPLSIEFKTLNVASNSYINLALASSLIF